VKTLGAIVAALCVILVYIAVVSVFFYALLVSLGYFSTYRDWLPPNPLKVGICLGADRQSDREFYHCDR
jgi:hypothetical protein